MAVPLRFKGNANSRLLFLEEKTTSVCFAFPDKAPLGCAYFSLEPKGRVAKLEPRERERERVSYRIVSLWTRKGLLTRCKNVHFQKKLRKGTRVVRAGRRTCLRRSCT